MAKQGIDLGTAGDLTTGDNVRDAFDKVNDNFTEVYSDIVNLQTDDANDVTQVNGLHQQQPLQEQYMFLRQT